MTQRFVEEGVRLTLDYIDFCFKVFQIGEVDLVLWDQGVLEAFDSLIPLHHLHPATTYQILIFPALICSFAEAIPIVFLGSFKITQHKVTLSYNFIIFLWYLPCCFPDLSICVCHFFVFIKSEQAVDDRIEDRADLFAHSILQ